jgi:hypothetical protein
VLVEEDVQRLGTEPPMVRQNVLVEHCDPADVVAGW